MAIQRRSPHARQTKIDVGNGPYLARIVSHLDPSFMGSLKVTLLRDSGNVPGEETQTYIVKCASPFFGYTGFEFTGSNSATVPGPNGEVSTTAEAYNDTQKSYGMWMVPPDVGVTVLVVFVDGDPSQGYWIGCIPSNFANHMVPAIGSSRKVDYSPADKSFLNTNQPLPVAEINKRINRDRTQSTDPKEINKALHPIAERFLEQGLLEDDVRGTTTSSARREVPSMVFGISTPGPRDKRPGAPRKPVGTSDSFTNTFVSRLGGTQFVMDDGEERFQRKTPAGQGPVDYADVLAGEKGDPTIPYNEYFRVRTRTGHQLLMHNSEDLIYIANSRGTAWIELTSNGKIDIYAADSVSIHSEADLNFYANRDVNIEAGRNISVKSGGKTHLDVGDDLEVLVGANGKLTFASKLDIVAVSDTKLTTTGKLDIASTLTTKLTAGTGLDIGSGGPTKITSNETLDILAGGNLTVTAARVDVNGPAAVSAESAEAAEAAKQLDTYPNIVTNINAGWTTRRYIQGTTFSIMKRIPMHEPWPLHEHFAPGNQSVASTDRTTPIQGSLGPNTNPDTDPKEILPAPGTLQEREVQAMDFYISKGFTPEQAAGIIGNLIAESNLNPGAIARNDAGPGKDSEGIAQWNRERLDALKRFALSKGTEDFKNYEIQLEFVVVELRGTPSGFTREARANRELSAASTVEDSTLAMTKYERFRGYEAGFASAETQKRIGYAKRVLTQYSSRSTVTPEVEPRPV